MVVIIQLTDNNSNHALFVLISIARNYYQLGLKEVASKQHHMVGCNAIEYYKLVRRHCSVLLVSGVNYEETSRLQIFYAQ